MQKTARELNSSSVGNSLHKTPKLLIIDRVPEPSETSRLLSFCTPHKPFHVLTGHHTILVDIEEVEDLSQLLFPEIEARIRECGKELRERHGGAKFGFFFSFRGREITPKELVECSLINVAVYVGHP